MFWRGVVSTYISKTGSIELNKSLRLLRRKSCKGCKKCGWLEDEIRELVNCEEIDISNIENGKIYTCKITASKGYFDDYDDIESIEFIEVEEE